MSTPNESLARFDPVFGIAVSAQKQAVDAFMSQVATAQLPRKGRLYLLLPPDADPSLITRAYEQYYEDRSYDPFNTLLRALAWASSEMGDPTTPVAGITIHGLDMHALGSTGSALLLVRNGQIESLFPGYRGPAIALPPGDPLAAYSEYFAYCTRRRLYAGDHLVLTTPDVAERESRRRLARVLSSGPGVAALALAKVGRKHRKGAVAPALVISLPGYTALGALEPAPREVPRQLNVTRPSERRVPSIWLALLVCLLAIGLTVLLRRPQVSLTDLEIVFDRLIQPVTTIVAPVLEGTPEPTATGETSES